MQDDVMGNEWSGIGISDSGAGRRRKEILEGRNPERKPAAAAAAARRASEGAGHTPFLRASDPLRHIPQDVGRADGAGGRTDRRKQFDSQNATRGDRASSSRRSAAEQTSGVVSVDHSRDPKFAGRCFSPSKTWFMPRSSEWRSSFPPLSPLPSHGSISVKSQGRRERERERERGESSFQTIRLPVLPATRVNPPMERLTN